MGHKKTNWEGKIPSSKPPPPYVKNKKIGNKYNLGYLHVVVTMEHLGSDVEWYSNRKITDKEKP